MTYFDRFLFGYYPYLALTVFLLGSLVLLRWPRACSTAAQSPFPT